MWKCITALLVAILIVFYAVPVKDPVIKSSDGDAVADIIEESKATVKQEALPLEGKTICIDAGHGITSLHRLEPIAPESNITKAAFVSGTAGNNGTEQQVNLQVALKLEQKLAEAGATVLMTRKTAECDLSNIDRAMLANEAKADLTVRIHADGSDNKNISGISVLIPSAKYVSDEDILKKSRKSGEIILEELINATGAVNRGIVERSDLTGFNWSSVPVILVEMGFMTNPEEEYLLTSDEYQGLIVEGIFDGLYIYFTKT